MTSTATRPLILVADDDPEMRQVIRRGLSPLDAEVVEARDGEEALARILEDEPDLVVLDVMMPGLSGWEICKYVRSKPAHAGTKVLMLTGIGHTVNELTSPLYGADAYLDKPVDIDDLLDTTRRLLDEATAPVAAD